MKKVSLYIEFSPEIHKNIVENRLSISDYLINNNLDASFSYEARPYENEIGVRDKDLVLTILASSALILSLGAAVSKVLRSIYRKPFLVEYYDIVQLLDAQGKALRDHMGDPILRTVKRFELIEPQPDVDKMTAEVSWSESMGVVIKYTSMNDQMPPKK